MGLLSGDVDELMMHLISESFLNEERFARAFAGGKFRMKKWGRIKISHALEGKGVSLNCIKIGLQEIDEQQYHDTLRKMLEKKKAEIIGVTMLEARNRVAKYGIQKGFEPDLVWRELRNLMPD
jgi:regulatory protein